MEAVVRTPQQLASVLRAQRARRGLTQARAGKDVGLLPKTISALEQRPEKSSIESLFRLLSALGVELVVRERPGDSRENAAPEW